MLSGCCVLTSKHHGADGFIEQGKNGFLLPDNPLSYAEAIHMLINEGYREAVEIGQEAKKTAQDIFSIDKYLDDMWEVIQAVAAGNKPVWNGESVS